MSNLVESIKKLNYLTKAGCALSGSDPWNVDIAGAKTIYGTDPNKNPLLSSFAGDHNIFIFENNLITCGVPFKFKNISYSNKYIAQHLKCGTVEEFTRGINASLKDSGTEIAKASITVSDAAVIGSSNQTCPAGISGCGTQDCDVRCTEIPRGFVVKDMAWTISTKATNTSSKYVDGFFSKIVYPSFSTPCQLGCTSSTAYSAGPRPSTQYIWIKKFYNLQGTLTANNFTRVGIGADLQGMFVFKPCKTPIETTPIIEQQA